MSFAPRDAAAIVSTRWFRRAAGIALFVAMLVSPFVHAHGETLFTSSRFFPGGTFTTGIEGPACDAAGNLYAVCYGSRQGIGMVTPGGVDSLYAELPKGSWGNGIRFDSHGDMLVADYNGHNILKINTATGDIDTLAHNSTMHQPNDIAIDANDVIYASDPYWNVNPDTGGQIWRITPAGTVTRIATGLGTTNGIEVSPDGKTLYVNESKQHDVLAFDISSSGTLKNKRILYEFADVDTTDLDGMRCDTAGNLYITYQSPPSLGKGSIAIISPSGTLLHTVTLHGQKPTNITFGGIDGRTCYVTIADSGSIETFRTDTPGQSWQLFQDHRTFVASAQPVSPRPFTFTGAAPNPFNPSTVIGYTLHRNAVVEIAVYNIAGQRVAVLHSGPEQAGRHTVTWNAGRFASGVYFARIQAGGVSESKKIVLLK